MLSYLHGFHAGNHADVFKHSVLTLLLETLTTKPKPLTYLETHAGAGIYDLTSEQARKTSEAADGIKRLWARRTEFPELAAYFNAIAALNTTNEIVRYPGSPYFAQAGLRNFDQLILMELHPTEVQTLRHHFNHDARIHLHQRNSYEGLPALLPPTPSRGVVLIDPSYETAIEVRQVAATVLASYQRWRSGCYLIWYPRLGVQRDQANQLLSRLLRQVPTLLTAELWVRPQTPNFGMCGSGLAVINPPWQFELQLQALLPRLAAVLSIAPLKDAGWHVEWRTGTTA